MKATGIVRRIDELGRIVIPKEIRRSLRIREGAPLEVYIERSGEVILKKYSPVAELRELAQGYVDSLFESTGRRALIVDNDVVVAVAGLPKDEWLKRAVTPDLEKIMDERRPVRVPAGAPDAEGESLLRELGPTAVAPIVSGGDTNGAVILCAPEGAAEAGELELKLAETAAGFLARQMET